ncbi:unnamed protein product [Callosobruchus maculatus]|nr:unnamed protein product [Callosobruchus maculatus]
MYSATYAATINTMPGAFYIIGGSLTVFAALMFGWLYIQAMRIQKEGNVNEQTMPKQEAQSRESSGTSMSNQEARNDGATGIPGITENTSIAQSSGAINLAFHIER